MDSVGGQAGFDQGHGGSTRLRNCDQPHKAVAGRNDPIGQIRGLQGFEPEVINLTQCLKDRITGIVVAQVIDSGPRVICFKPTDVISKTNGDRWTGLASCLVQTRSALCG